MRAAGSPTGRALARAPSCGCRAGRAPGRSPDRPAARRARAAPGTSTQYLRLAEVVQDHRAEGAVARDAGVSETARVTSSLLLCQPAGVARAVRLERGQACPQLQGVGCFDVDELDFAGQPRVRLL